MLRLAWGGTFYDDFQPQLGDVVAHEHRGSRGFAKATAVAGSNCVPRAGSTGGLPRVNGQVAWLSSSATGWCTPSAGACACTSEPPCSKANFGVCTPTAAKPSLGVACTASRQGAEPVVLCGRFPAHPAQHPDHPHARRFPASPHAVLSFRASAPRPRQTRGNPQTSGRQTSSWGFRCPQKIKGISILVDCWYSG